MILVRLDNPHPIVVVWQERLLRSQPAKLLIRIALPSWNYSLARRLLSQMSAGSGFWNLDEFYLLPSRSTW